MDEKGQPCEGLLAPSAEWCPLSLTSSISHYFRTAYGISPAYKTSKVMSTPFSLCDDRLVGLVVKASASRAEGPGFESRLRWDFFGVESYQ